MRTRTITIELKKYYNQIIDDNLPILFRAVDLLTKNKIPSRFVFVGFLNPELPTPEIYSFKNFMWGLEFRTTKTIDIIQNILKPILNDINIIF